MNLNAVKLLKESTAGSFSYTNAGGEQTVIEITDGNKRMIGGVWLDLTTMTQNGTIKAYYKVDGTNYREVTSQAFTVATDSVGLWMAFDMGIEYDFKITYTEGADEGADRAIPYQIVSF